MKQVLILITIVILHFNVLSQTPVAIHGALSVAGNQIVNSNGNPVSFAGNSLFWSNNGWGGENFYNAAVVDWIYNDWNATIVRAAMGVEDAGGYISDVTNKQKVTTVVDAAIAEGMYVIIDWHSHHAEDYQSQAISFFEDMATLYNGYDNVIYEIYNEPLNTTSWSNDIKPYAEAVIAAIRAIDSTNLIIVGTPTWSQDVDIASNNPITGYSNIAYTLHFYAGTHGQSLRNKAQTALNNGIALMVTEWGSVNANGNGAVAQAETNLWMDFLCDNNITHCNWALNDKNEGASALIPGASNTGNWTANDLTSSGTLVKNIIQNWNGNCLDSLVIIPDTIDQPPVAIISANVSGGVAPLTVTVNGNQSYDADGSLLTYNWDFGDGNIAAGITNNHTYNNDGIYTITLIVTNDSALIGTDYYTINVNSSPCNLAVYYKTSDNTLASANDNAIRPHLIVENTGSVPINLADVKIRYWYLKEGSSNEQSWIDYSILNAANITTTSNTMVSPTSDADSYFEVGFLASAGMLNPGQNTGDIQTRFSKTDWTSYDETNDYSYDMNKNTYQIHNKVTLYCNNILALGIEPSNCNASLNISNIAVNNFTYQVGQFINSDAYVNSGKTINYKAGNFINLINNFEVQIGANFSAEIDGCN